MKGQSEVLIFVLLFLISIGLFTTTIFWSRGLFQQNVDKTKVSSAETFVKELNDNILNLIKFGNYQEMDYRVDGIIALLNNTTIEVRTVVTSVELPRYWINIHSDSSYIREILDGDVFRVQLIYPESDYKVEFFTEGPTLSKPKKIKIEKNSTTIENNKLAIKIRISFM